MPTPASSSPASPRGSAATPSDVLIASTGVIGRRYPMDRIRAGVAALPEPARRRLGRRRRPRDHDDRHASRRSPRPRSRAARARVVGIAKGVGMIEPDMATMIAVVLTDADDRRQRPRHDVPARGRPHVQLRQHRHRHLDERHRGRARQRRRRTGRPRCARDGARTTCACALTKQIARDGEGAETLIEVTRRPAPATIAQAKRVAKAIVNSPLVKTAVHGADPNWGRVAMAIGKCSDDTDIDHERVVIRFGGTEVYPNDVDDGRSRRTVGLHARRRGPRSACRSGPASASATVWGCDLTDGYVRINADYTT